VPFARAGAGISWCSPWFAVPNGWRNSKARIIQAGACRQGGPIERYRCGPDGPISRDGLRVVGPETRRRLDAPGEACRITPASDLSLSMPIFTGTPLDAPLDGGNGYTIQASSNSYSAIDIFVYNHIGAEVVGDSRGHVMFTMPQGTPRSS
jgi:hypothetical protein